MNIIVDAMGGDNAPSAVVRGALDAASELDINITLVGRRDAVMSELQALGGRPAAVEVCDAPEVISMHDDPSLSVKNKPNSSLVAGAKLLASGGGDAYVSAGNTGALLSAGTLMVKRIKGVRRAALSPFVPCKGGNVLIIDCGANVECSPEYLLQFAVMGGRYFCCQRGVSHPRVGLLNIGAEDTKGDALRREAYTLLKQAHTQGKINFVGNVEGRDVAFGAADVVVTDGFSGNILLKTTEGVGLFFAGLLKDMFKKSLKTKIAALLVKDGIADFKKLLDYSETGGSPILGLSKPVIKAHGASNAKAIKNAIRQAKLFAESGAIGSIGELLGAAGADS